MRMSKYILASTAVLAIGIGAYIAHDRFLVDAQPASAATPPPFAMPVPIAKAVRKKIPLVLEYSARTDAISSISLLPKVPGYIAEQTAADGSDVKKGDLLYRIDPSDFQAVVDQANAAILRDTAALDYAHANAARGDQLSLSGNLAKDTQEQRESAARQAEAALQLDQAALHSAQLNLSYTEIRAPFDGRLGRNQAPVGTLVNASGTGLNTLVQLDPLYITFHPAEVDLAQIQNMQSKGDIDVDVFAPGSSAPPHIGKLTFMDNSVDRATGTIVARATIANADGTWLPGQYVRVRLHMGELPDAVTTPQVALGSSQLGKYIYIVGKDSKAEQRIVTLGPVDGDSVVISSGVAEGDPVIVGNLQKIGPGSLVQPITP